MTTDPLTAHIDADILERCAGDIEAAAAWQIQTLRGQVRAAREAQKPRWIYPLDHLRSLPDGSLTATEVSLLCNEIERYGRLLDQWDEFYDEGFSGDYETRERVREEIAKFMPPADQPEPAWDYRRARGVIDLGGEPAEQAIRRQRDGADQ